MSATETLRRLLDERGVEWEDCGNGATYVEHNGEAWRFDYDEPFDQLGIVCLSGYTPAQAIDATLGRGTCRDLSGTGANGEQVFKCSECGCVLSLYDRDGSNNLCTGFIFDYPRYCPECGRKVVE